MIAIRQAEERRQEAAMRAQLEAEKPVALSEWKGWVPWAANKRFEVSKFEFKFPRARIYELIRARSRIYRSQILQLNIRWN